MNTQQATRTAKEKTYAVDVRNRGSYTRNGHEETFDLWRQAATISATRAGTAIRHAERILPGKEIRVRLLTAQFTYRTFNAEGISQGVAA